MWRRNRVALTMIGILAFILGFMATFSSNSGVPFCSLPKVHAQDNPCLAQESTISAMKAELLQSTIDNINYKATIASLTNLGQTGESATKVTDTSFTDTFDNNSRGWDLTSNDLGGASISKGKLVLSVRNSYVITRVTVPNLEASDFFIETDVTVSKDYEIFVGFYLGGEDNYHTVVVGTTGENLYQKWLIQLAQHEPNKDDTILQETPLDKPIWSNKSVFKLGLEAKSGLYTVFIDGQEQTSFQLVPKGNKVGFAFFSHSYPDENATFDNLVVRPTK